MATDVGEDGAVEVADLLEIEGVEGGAETSAAVTDLDEEEKLASSHDEVELAAPDGDVPLEEAKALAPQLAEGG